MEELHAFYIRKCRNCLFCNSFRFGSAMLLYSYFDNKKLVVLLLSQWYYIHHCNYLSLLVSNLLNWTIISFHRFPVYFVYLVLSSSHVCLNWNFLSIWSCPFVLFKSYNYPFFFFGLAVPRYKLLVYGRLCGSWILFSWDCNGM